MSIVSISHILVVVDVGRGTNVWHDLYRPGHRVPRGRYKSLHSHKLNGRGDNGAPHVSTGAYPCRLVLILHSTSTTSGTLEYYLLAEPIEPKARDPRASCLAQPMPRPARQQLLGGLAVLVATRATGLAPSAEFTCGKLLTVSSNFSYTLAPFEEPDATIAGGAYALLYGGKWLSSADGSLAPVGSSTQGSGNDAHGRFTSLTLSWGPAAAGADAAAAAAGSAAATLWITSFRCYLAAAAHDGAAAAVVFSQQFPVGLNDAPGGPRDFQQPSSRFPSFQTSSLAGRGMITFKGGNAGRTLHAGLFPDAYLAEKRSGGTRGRSSLGGYTSGPIAFGHDPASLGAAPILVVSPLNAFMAALHGVDNSSSSTVSFGVGGLMNSLSGGYTSEFVAVVHKRGPATDSYSGAVSSAFQAWGDFLLRQYLLQTT